MENFTPWSGLFGGALIGLAAVLFMTLQGRIVGISGIAAGLLQPSDGNAGWRVTFILGLVIAPLVVWAATSSKPVVIFDTALWRVAMGGLLVGFGSRLGGGCTSGHGVCGMARLSHRSIIATGVFMSTAIVTVFLFSPIVGR